MSWEKERENKCICPCGQGKIIQDVYGDDWNRYDYRTPKIECNVCSSEYKIIEKYYCPKPYHDYTVYYCVKKDVLDAEFDEYLKKSDSINDSRIIKLEI